MYSKLSVTNEVQSIQRHVHAQRGGRKTHGRSTGLILHPECDDSRSKILRELQRDHATDGLLVDEEAFLEPLNGERLRGGQLGLTDVESIKGLDLERQCRVPVGNRRCEDV